MSHMWNKAGCRAAAAAAPRLDLDRLVALDVEL
eukprot:CAMPEP_0179239570 /NCGR_PEP_ID=MMETSP0797-20121207/15529_1 /TAXON_ID=47934 /ORGANISM="Dinophysis acuminata, Strain DAEP01" /LENGTH=32 /DNA_ID= /DNA_START= /DNA_END= /DNA_ORIENTATION=